MARRVSLFSFIVAFVVSVFCFAVSPAYATEYTRNGSSIDWSVDTDGTLTIAPISGTTGVCNTKGSSSPWTKSGVRRIVVPDGCRIVLGSNCTSLFSGMSDLVSIDFSKFDTSGVINMSRMFYGCSSLTSFDVSDLDTSNVTDMSSMFQNCSGLASVNMSGLDTSNVTTMRGLFYWCTKLTDVNLNLSNTQSVTDMSQMFYNCGSLSTLDLSHLDTRNVKKMTQMFSSCGSLVDLDMSNFDTSNVISMSNMFYGCRSLTSLDLSKFDTHNVTSMDSMFSTCSSLSSLDLSNFDTSNVTSFSSMFSSCSSLANLDLSSFDTSSAGYMGYMFSGCKSLTSLDLSKFDTGNVKDMQYMFSGCSGLTNLDLSGFNTSNVTDMKSMFNNCSSLTSVNLSSFDVSSVEISNSMFKDCSSLTNLDLSSFDTSSLQNMYQMFYGCSSLSSLDISRFDTHSVFEMSDVFYNCYSLKSVKLGSHNPFHGVSEEVSMTLPVPGIDTIFKWVNMKDPDHALTVYELRDQYDGSDESMVGEWVWAYAKTRIEFYPNGGVGVMDPIVINGNETAVIPDCDFMYFDHDFVYWSPSPTGMSSNRYSVGDTVPGIVSRDATLQLYAIWSERDHTRNVVDGGFDVTAPAGCRLVVNGLPAGTSYVITESDSKGWNAVDVEGASGVIPAADVGKSLFVNQYSPNVATARIVGIKTLDGRPGEGFVFELCEGDTVVSTAMSDASGAVMFDTIMYDVAGVHDYVVREVPVGKSDVTYDASEYPVRVTVTDNDGTLSASVSYPDGNVSFANETMPGRLLLRKLTQGGGDASGDDSFTFTIRFTNGYDSTLQDVLMRKQVVVE